MSRILIVAKRVLTQLRHDKRLLGLSVMAPLLIIYLLKIFFDTMPKGFNNARYIMPITAFMVHFLAFLLCAIVLVQERTAGTLERMFINGFRRIEIIGGYVLGYILLATFQAIIALAEALWLFDLRYAWGDLALLFGVIWLLAITSVMLGMFISTFARHEGQVFPFIPLIILPSVFLSGLLINPEQLPTWANWLGHAFPLFYANDAIQEIIGKTPSSSVIWTNIVILLGYGLFLLTLASRTLKDVE